MGKRAGRPPLSDFDSYFGTAAFPSDEEFILLKFVRIPPIRCLLLPEDRQWVFIGMR